MKMFYYTTPEQTVGMLRHDKGWAVKGQPDTHPSGRVGYSFEIPDGTPNGWGAEVMLNADKMVPVRHRGILMFGENNLAYLLVDDFQLAPEKICPEVPPIPPQPEPPHIDTPLQAIKEIYNTGRFDLSTKEGCGRFTEECCDQLHSLFSKQYGHLRKTGAQNQYNGHAVDALNLLADHVNHNGTLTPAGVYDIIVSSESADAKPAFNRVGDAVPALWYYPA